MSDPGTFCWYIVRDGRKHGPLHTEELRLFVTQGHLKEGDVIQRDNSSGDRHAIYYPANEIRAYFQRQTPSEHPTPNVPENSKRNNGRLIGLHQLRPLLSAVTNEIFRNLIKAKNFLFRPKEFATSHITSHSQKTFHEALSFFITFFSLAFLIFSSTTYFSFYIGASEARMVTKIAVQLLFGILFLFVLLKLLRSDIDLASTIKIVLYFDGLYLILSAIVYCIVGIIAFGLTHPKIDIFGTAFEECLDKHSIAYWLIRGDLEFYIDEGKLHGIPYFILTYSYFAVAILCIIAIGRVFGSFYRPNTLVFISCAFFTFVTIDQGYAYVEQKVIDKIAAQYPNCWDQAVMDTVSRYRGDILKPQLLMHLRQEIRDIPVKDHRFVDLVFPNISLNNGDLLVQAAFPSSVIDLPDQRLIETAERFAVATYCNNW